MKILAKIQFNNKDEYYNKLPPATMVKRVGNFLAKNLEGVYKVLEKSNTYILYTTILYQIKPEVRKAMKPYQKEFQGIEETIYEMNIYLNVTTYQKCIRVDVIELDENEKTLGFIKFTPEDLISLPYCKQKLLAYIKKRIEKAYEMYELLI